jgi:hypothetical protein
MASSQSTIRATGRCLCGAVAYEVRGPMRDVVNCHCAQCRRTHGHVAAYSNVLQTDLVMTETRGLKWFQSSESARRGFCQECGASLFWDPLDRDTISIAAGAIDGPNELKTVRHIYVADKGDYYDIQDDLEQLPQGHTRS